MRYLIMVRILTFVLSIVGISVKAIAQDTLPKFTALLKSHNRIVISWTNAYPFTSQISIQRSTDSTRNFKTILTVPDASVPQNGFVDTKSPTPFMFYRLFIVLDSGKYQFSKSKRAVPDTAKIIEAIIPAGNNQRILVSDSLSTIEVKELKEKGPLPPPVKVVPVPKPDRFFIVKRKDSLLARIAEKDFKKFRDSIVYSTKDTMVFLTVDSILIRPFVPKEVYKASKFVYTEKYGNVMISLPEALNANYAIRFFEQKGTNPEKLFLFDIKRVKSASLIVDKANFMHSGWFWFELYEDGKIKEKNKFFIPKDF
ncbi:MAG: hypothetical protein ABI687_02680 [Flavitalea sp.]